MKKITLEKKIELITAYAEGKAVEVYDKDSDEWFAKEYDAWDFDGYNYRIKPDETTKFAVGDTLVFMRVAGEPNPFRYKITEVSDNSYKFEHVSPTPIEEVDKNFINEQDVLWYFEIYDYATKKYSMHPTRMTINEMDEEFGANHDTLSWKPMYSLGFKLKEN